MILSYLNLKQGIAIDCSNLKVDLLSLFEVRPQNITFTLNDFKR